ncbi:ATP-binding protein [Listeria costaricensis]|uniref:ATP-binding protein n=1 Tax=Listeria costaricensis TaxID=2026604 RepID=UPI001968D324|nr:helicase HerA-like domain-containing protein [Listeria costaricensis]
MPGIYRKKDQLVSKVNQDMASVLTNHKDFNLSDLPLQISEETNQVNNKGDRYVSNAFQFNQHQWLVQKVQYKLNNTSLMDFFNNDSNKKSLIDELDAFISEQKSSLYIDVSEIGVADGIGGMIIDLISNYLINKKTIPNPFVLFIDEVHRYTKLTNFEVDFYTGLTSIAREGRKKGVFLFLTTQNPQDVSSILLGQIGTLLIHRLTQSEELKAIQNHLKSNSLGQVRKLNRGEAILTSINLLQDIHLKIYECGRKHNNCTPIL